MSEVGQPSDINSDNVNNIELVKIQQITYTYIHTHGHTQRLHNNVQKMIYTHYTHTHTHTHTQSLHNTKEDVKRSNTAELKEKIRAKLQNTVVTQVKSQLK
jgi:hypothetical protein